MKRVEFYVESQVGLTLNSNNEYVFKPETDRSLLDAPIAFTITPESLANTARLNVCPMSCVLGAARL